MRKICKNYIKLIMHRAVTPLEASVYTAQAAYQRVPCAAARAHSPTFLLALWEFALEVCTGAEFREPIGFTGELPISGDSPEYKKYTSVAASVRFAHL